MLVLECWQTTSYGAISQWYYRKDSNYRYCTDINYATEIDKVDADSILGGDLSSIEPVTLNHCRWRLIKVN